MYSLNKLLILACGALGHGDNQNRHTPTPVKELRKEAKIK